MPRRPADGHRWSSSTPTPGRPVRAGHGDPRRPAALCGHQRRGRRRPADPGDRRTDRVEPDPRPGVRGDQPPRSREFYDADRLAGIADRVLDANTPTVLIGWGASLVPVRRVDPRARRPRPLGDPAAPAPGRAELALRQRRRGHPTQGQARLLRGVAGGRPAQARAVRRDGLRARHQPLGGRGEADQRRAFRAGMPAAVSSPFRVVPFFDPGVWGGQWMKGSAISTTP